MEKRLVTKEAIKAKERGLFEFEEDCRWQEKDFLNQAEELQARRSLLKRVLADERDKIIDLISHFSTDYYSASYDELVEPLDQQFVK
ncbi:hypothetical protein [Streptococcus oricebi]|uniref:Transcriptional regulator n=1 Tax=Streptococcus oricebi TaxID=1547447 RepID=A0ABS5B570_9STRE|nr:hypothetical protein [Streptococcus oricebi]MBP2623987.1 hypothetical protein [Streptococcus oricebi]